MNIDNLTREEMEELYVAACAMRAEHHAKKVNAVFNSPDKKLYQAREELLSGVVSKIHGLLFPGIGQKRLSIDAVY